MKFIAVFEIPLEVQYRVRIPIPGEDSYCDIIELCLPDTKTYAKQFHGLFYRGVRPGEVPTHYPNVLSHSYRDDGTLLNQGKGFVVDLREPPVFDSWDESRKKFNQDARLLVPVQCWTTPFVPVEGAFRYADNVHVASPKGPTLLYHGQWYRATKEGEQATHYPLVPNGMGQHGFVVEEPSVPRERPGPFC